MGKNVEISMTLKVNIPPRNPQIFELIRDQVSSTNQNQFTYYSGVKTHIPFTTLHRAFFVPRVYAATNRLQTHAGVKL